MARNLLPRLRQTPNPANVPPARVADWTELNTPGALAQLDFGSGDTHIRTRIQSIPSPWARMLLFKNALEEDGHPARLLVQSELLDALEFLWSMRSRAGSQPEFVNIQVSTIEELAERQVSQRVERFARALIELMPRRHGASVDPAFGTLTYVLVDGKPVIATSPYTLLFTAEDASKAVGGTLFRYADGSPYRGLVDRPFSFQQYIARVLLPQLDRLTGAASSAVDSAAVLRLVKPWLQDEVRAAQAKAGRRSAELERPLDDNWQEAARLLDLTSLDALASDFTLFASAANAQVAASRWMLRPGRAGVVNPPLVLEPSQFDGVYFPGAAKVTLPRDLADADRRVLPGHGLEYPWASPTADWFADRLLPLSQPLEPSSVQGFSSFASRYDGPHEYLKRPQFALPLTTEVFRYFDPQDVARRLSISVDVSGRVTVSLRVPVGSAADGRELKIERLYDATTIEEAIGPELALWPRFRAAGWQNYTLFRRDTTPTAASFLEVLTMGNGAPLSPETERRNDLVRVATFAATPEVLEFGSSITGAGGRTTLGVVIPRFDHPTVLDDKKLQVGIDFGTSNTVASIRSVESEAGDIFGVQQLTLPLTQATPEAQAEADAYFLPHTMRAAPFGTAVMHFANLPHYDIIREPLGVRVNIPFSGVVRSDEKNVVVGDLKWSSTASRQFLSAGFLRHLLVVIAAEAVQRGVKPENIDVAWAHPRAFTAQQVNAMRNLWSQVTRSLESTGVRLGSVSESVDESQAVLRHFFADRVLGPAGDATAILDIGGGTSDIAVYARGRAILLDSVMIGGRDLTGARTQGSSSADLANPFVARFLDWSKDRSLSHYPTEARAVAKYLGDRQDHLAFAYLVQGEWFKAHGAQFAGADAFPRFQALVFYCFGGLFYYLGLALRGTDALPKLVMLAGNGSQYLHWLTDLVKDADPSAFTRGLGRLMLAGAQAPPETPLPKIQMTRAPKHEVALGLVARVRADALVIGDAKAGPIAGERIRFRPRADGPELAFDSTSPIDAANAIEPMQASSLQWDDPEIEIERYHDALVPIVASLGEHGAQWRENAAVLQEVLESLRGGRLQDLTRNRLQYLGSLHGAFHGSLFALELSVVLERMLAQFFGATSQATRGVTHGSAKRA